MKLVCQTKLHFKEGNSDKIYEVDLCETGGRYVVNFRYGRRGTELKEGTKTVSPVELAEAEKVFQKLVDEKTRKGYHIVGTTSEADAKPKTFAPQIFDETARRARILEKLRDPKAKSNPRIERLIWRAGELKIGEAAPFIAELVGTAKDLRDYCCAWSLGFCGDASSVPVLEKLVSHQAEFVRRIAREAILKLSDEPARARILEKYRAALPEPLRQLSKSGTPESFETALRQELEKQKRGALMILSQIYELDNALTRPAFLKLLREIPFKPRYFKPVRHIFKTAEYRRDAEVFGILARRFEIETAGFHSSPWWDSVYLYNAEKDEWTTVKRAEELAKENSRIAYGNKTKDYLRRRTWRTLRRLGELENASEYVKLAVGALLAYTDADAHAPYATRFYDYHHTGSWDWRNPRIVETHYDKFAPYLLFNHILYENSPRYEMKAGTRKFCLRENAKADDPPPSVREEAFPTLWEARPHGLLHLLAESQCSAVHEFAVRALRGCREFIESLDLGAILMLLERPYEITYDFGFELAESRYDAQNPNVELAVAVAVCASEKARRTAFGWIDEKRAVFGQNETALCKLLTAKYKDTRDFAVKLMQTTNYGETEAQNLIARLISELFGLGESERETAADLGAAVFQSFGKHLRTLNLQVINDLLRHPLVEVQIFGGQILVNHETPAENLPNDLIDSLINSPFEQIRTIGLRLFGQLPDENLLKREKTVFAFLTHELADVQYAIRPTLMRLSENHPQFRANLVNAVFIELLQTEKAEGLHKRLVETLREIPDWPQFADLETAKFLTRADSAKANEVGGLIVQNRANEWREDFSTGEIIEFTNHEILAVRRASWQIAEKTADILRGKTALLIRALDAKWADSREFWRGFFRTKLTENELTPEILVAVCDSVRNETQKFGRDLLLELFRTENGVEYLTKLSEHPAPAMQLFATNYLEIYASDAPDRLLRLKPYFIRVLSLVNRARPAKTRVLQFLEREALKSAESAQIAAEIIGRQSATLAIGDKASMIETMLKIRRRFPEIELPIKLKDTEVRADAF